MKAVYVFKPLLCAKNYRASWNLLFTASYLTQVLLESCIPEGEAEPRLGYLICPGAELGF